MGSNMVRLCPICGQMVEMNEWVVFGGRHEDCWIDVLPSLDTKTGSMIEACAEACETNPGLKEAMRKAAMECGVTDKYRMTDRHS